MQRLLPGLLLRLLLAPFLVLFGSVVSVFSAVVLLLADKEKAAAGESIVLTVRSADDELEVYDAATGGGLVAKVKVEGGKATWTIPADRKAGVVFVRDSASMTDVAVEVEAKK